MLTFDATVVRDAPVLTADVAPEYSSRDGVGTGWQFWTPFGGVEMDASEQFWIYFGGPLNRRRGGIFGNAL